MPNDEDTMTTTGTEDTSTDTTSADNSAEVDTSTTETHDDTDSGSDNAIDTSDTSGQHTDDQSSGEENDAPVEGDANAQDTEQPEDPDAPIKSHPLFKQLEQRYNNHRSMADSRYGRAHSRLKALEEEVTKFRKVAETEQLPIYNKRHPKYDEFKGLRTKARMIDEQVRNLSVDPNLPPEQREAAMNAARSAIMSQMKPEELEQLRAYQADARKFQETLHEDPEAALAPIIQAQVQQILQKERSTYQADTEVEQDFNDPTLKPLIEANKEEFARSLEAGVPYKYAVHLLKLYAGYKAANEEVSRLRKGTVQVDEQKRLMKGRASMTRDPRAGKTFDPYAVAKKWAEQNGHTTDSIPFRKKLADLIKSQHS